MTLVQFYTEINDILMDVIDEILSREEAKQQLEILILKAKDLNVTFNFDALEQASEEAGRRSSYEDDTNENEDSSW